jgi:phage portal protein BeeE
MHPFKAIRTLIKKVFDPTMGLDLTKIGWRKVGGNGVYNFYKRNDMENGYSSIRVIVNNFAKIEPYTIDKNGKSVASNILDRIYTPNTDFSAYEFREALAVTTLVHNKVRIRVHSKDGVNFKADTITGFTILEDEVENIIDGKRLYNMPNGDQFTDKEIITLLNINPYDLDAGFSPASAARRWTTLDDYIADYQKGFFENGAVPSGQLIITAKNTQDFNDQVDMLQARHKGASHSGNITYTHRPVDATGKAQQAGIEWQPFSTQNKDMALKDLFTNVNQKIDSSYGVPASLRAVNTNNTYASVKVDQKILIDNTIEPMTLKIWGKFTHELNRICGGGTGVAIVVDIESPEIADEELVKAQTVQTNAQTVISLTTIGGYTAESAIAYVKSGDVEKLIKADKKADKDEPVVVESSELKDLPSQPIDQFSKSKTKLKLKGISDSSRVLYMEKVSNVVNNQMRKQVDKAIDGLDEAMKSKAFADTTSDDDEEFSAALALVLMPLINNYGQKVTNYGIKLILESGLSAEKVEPFMFTDAQREAYEKYLAKVGTSYNEYTAEQIRNILNRGILDGATTQEVANSLKTEILGSPNEYRVTRIANTEVHMAENKASLSSMQNIIDQTGYQIYMGSRTTSDNPCEFCLEMQDIEVPVGEVLVEQGGSIHGVDGGIYHNDFNDIDTPDYHPNCMCVPEYRIEEK